MDYPTDAQTLQLDDLTLDPVAREASRAGKPIRLRRKEFDILEYLMRHQGKVVSRSMIMNDIWGPETASWDGTVNVHIKRLRDKVDRPYGRKLIKTAYGLGYIIGSRP